MGDGLLWEELKHVVILPVGREVLGTGNWPMKMETDAFKGVPSPPWGAPYSTGPGEVPPGVRDVTCGSLGNWEFC